MVTESRLKLARQRQGISLIRLAEVSGIPLRTLSAYENGVHQPATANLERLAEVLEVKPGFFSLDEVELLDADAVSFRKLSKTTAGRRDAALAAGRMAIDIGSWIEARFKTPDPDIPTLEKHSPDAAAMIVRERWQLGEAPIANMVHLAEAHGVRIFSLASDCRDVDALSVMWDAQPYIFVNTTVSAERQRFDVAHELGHLVLHCTSERVHGREKEDEANRFAASFLMPERAVKAQGLLEAPIERIFQAKRYWRVAAMAMTHRLHELHLLSEWRYRSTCIDLNKHGYRKAEPDGFNPETSQVLAKVVAAMRPGQASGLRTISNDLELPEARLNQYLFDLVPTLIEGGRRTSPSRAQLNLVN